MKNLTLKSVGLEKGQLYEAIVSTSNRDGVKNATPIGVLCKNEYELVLYLYQGSQTHENILFSSSFVVNLIRDASLFTKSILDKLSPDHFVEGEDNPILKENEAYIVARVINKKEIIRKNGWGLSKMTVLTAQAEKIVKNEECVYPLNRGVYAVIESLIHFTRLNLANKEDRKKLYVKIRELNKITQKVGSEREKRAMQDILDKIKANFSDLK